MLRTYREPEEAVKKLPTLRMITCSYEELRERAKAIEAYLGGLDLPGIVVDTVDTVSRVGGGALPLQELASRAVRIRTETPRTSISRIEESLRLHEPPVVARVEDDAILMDVRTMQPGEEKIAADALFQALDKEVRH